MATLLVSLALTVGVARQVAAQDLLRQGDELRISIPEVGGQVERVTAVNSDGEVSLGQYGSVAVAGMTIDEAQDVVRDHLQRYLRRTSGVAVTLERRQRTVLVTGLVVTPGLVTLEGAVDPWMAVQAAGGPAPGADLSRVAVFRDGRETPVDLRAFLTRERAEPLTELLTGDTVFVPGQPGLPAIQGGTGSIAAPFLGEAALQSKVFVLGAVATPGVYDRTPGLNPLTALALAGGPTPGADLSNVRLITMAGSERANLEAWMLGEGSGPGEIPSDGGAIMYIPTRTTGTVTDPFTSRVYLLGSIATTGPLEVDGPTPLLELLGQAGGYSENADLSEVHVIRQRERYSLNNRYDMESFLAEGGGAGSVLVEPGDVVIIGSLPPTTPWQDFVGGIGDLALVSSAVTLWLNYAQQTNN